MEAARAEADPVKRLMAYEALWRQKGMDLPFIYLWTVRNILGVSRKVTGVTVLANGLMPLQDIRPAP